MPLIVAHLSSYLAPANDGHDALHDYREGEGARNLCPLLIRRSLICVALAVGLMDYYVYI